jgi:small-conductance mechanosensitive channel
VVVDALLLVLGRDSIIQMATRNMVVDLLPNSMFELVMAWFLAFGADRIVAMIWEVTQQQKSTTTTAPGSVSKQQQSGSTIISDLRSTFLFGVTHSVAIAARVYLGLIVAELILDRFPSIVMFSNLSAESVSLRESAPSIAFTIWSGLTLCTIKRIIFLQSVPGRRLGRVALLDRLLDFVIVFVMILAVMDELSIDSTVGIQSVLSAGGVGALIFSLASKDLAEQIVGGVALNAWNAIDVGDKVRLNDGTAGTVLEIGLLETIIQGYDNIVTRIPNSQLTRARVSNLSRVTRSRLKQFIRFKYSDLDKLPAVLAEIKEEIRMSCPKLVSDGSKGFHAVLTSYEADHIQGMVLAHFDIQPATGDFIRNRQDVVFAIGRAMKKHGVECALPSVMYKNTSSNSPDPADYSC